MKFEAWELKQEWAGKVRDWLDAEIANLRSKNDNPKFDLVETANVRGQIELAKRLRGLLAEPTMQPRSDPE